MKFINQGSYGNTINTNRYCFNLSRFTAYNNQEPYWRFIKELE